MSAPLDEQASGLFHEQGQARVPFRGEKTQGWRRWASIALGLVFPQECPLCLGVPDREPDDGGLGPRFCRECARRLAPPIADRCRRCAAPVGPFLDTSHGCIHCRDDAFAFEGVVCLGVYDGPLRAACLRGKQSFGGPLTAALADLLWRRNRDALDHAAADVVLPVPLHWWDRLRRSHSHATVLAETLARTLRIACAAPILAKRRRTPAQASLTATERRNNLRDAFRARRRRKFAGKTVLLVDDVLTTGTTAHRCARVLRQAGAARVTIAVVARGIGAGAVAAQERP